LVIVHKYFTFFIFKGCVIFDCRFPLQALRFPQAVREASSALKRLRGLPCPVLLQESRAFRSNQYRPGYTA
jgi:hypothetical protein